VQDITTVAAGPASPALLTARTLTLKGTGHDVGGYSSAEVPGHGTDTDISTHEPSLELSVTL